MTPEARSPPPSPDSHLIDFLASRSIPCPRCGYDLRDIQTAKCPECGEPLVLKVGSPKARFGWLVLAMVPGCFSGVAAMFVLIPVIGTLWSRFGAGGNKGVMWPVFVADAFGFLSAASVALMYKHRHQIMHWPERRQIMFAGGVWGVHVLMFALLVLGLWFSQ